jgi:lincosamide nucleotidyltransferase A/C/D/E
VQRVKARITCTPESRVLAVLDLVAEAGVRAWVAGGWGVDALVGKQTRRHHDLDLVMDDQPEQYLRLAAALTRDGFRAEKPEFNPGLPMPWRHAWHHTDGHCVEVMPVPLHKPPFHMPSANQAQSSTGPFDQGVIGGRAVPCLSARLQMILHQGYPTREIDVADVGLLSGHARHMEGKST